MLLAAAVLQAHTGSIEPQPLRVAVIARSVQPGELVILTVTAPADVGHVRVRAFDRDIPVFIVGAQAWRALVGIDLDVKPGRYPVSIDGRADAAAVHRTYELHVLSRKFATRRLRVDDTFVNPPADVRERIEREAADLRQIWSASTPDRLWREPVVPPVPDPATSQFGTRSIFNGRPRPPHGGTDFPSPAGTPVQAPAAGFVALTRELYFSGNTVVIDHGQGFFSLLAHLSAFDVREGDRVGAGQIVGRVGATGRVTGPHLHWTVRLAGARVDPLSVLALLGRDVP